MTDPANRPQRKSITGGLARTDKAPTLDQVAAGISASLASAQRLLNEHSADIRICSAVVELPCVLEKDGATYRAVVSSTELARLPAQAITRLSLTLSLTEKEGGSDAV